MCNIATGRRLPTRLIWTGDHPPRLCLGIELAISTRYATLSHCWGFEKYTTLQNNTFEQFRKEVPSDALSKTFLDGTHIAREVGINHMWIDSLCIIQNDPTDWHREAASMTEVYGGSFLNIAASGASDGSIGCFFAREQGWRTQNSTITKGERLIYDVVLSSLLYHCLDEMPLSKRGWTLQERLLPTRTLHFSSSEVVWECRQEMACETFPEGFPPAVHNFGYQYTSSESRSMWNWIVERSTKCGLTNRSDRLVAISGIARRIQSQTREQYIAGLWREDIEAQLCWNIVHTHCKRTGPYRAPIWSWASVDKGIEFSEMERYGPGFLDIKILQARSTLSGSDPLGEILHGVLRVSCDVLALVTVVITSDDNYILVNENVVGESVIIYLDETSTTIYSDDEEEKMSYDLYAMPVQGYLSDHWMVGLLLFSTGIKGEFKRAGLLKLTVTKAPVAFERYVQDPRCHAKDEDYACIRKDKYGKTHRIINLV